LIIIVGSLIIWGEFEEKKMENKIIKVERKLIG